MYYMLIQKCTFLLLLQCCRRHEGDTVDAATDQGVRIVACSDEEEEYTIVEGSSVFDSACTIFFEIDRIINVWKKEISAKMADPF